MQTLPDEKEALNEYFKLKLNYETKIKNNKKKILNNTTLSNREKRSEYLKLKPKCINCQRPGGTQFKINYFESTNADEPYRQYSATCGIVADPCNLDIKINIGKTNLLTDLLNNIQKDIADTKNKVIDNKNKLLFGYLNTKDVLENFEELKEYISHYTSLYEIYLSYYNDIVDNEKKNKELNTAITDSYIQINEIKQCINKMNDSDNVQYARDAVNIYTNILTPLLDKIRTLKYNETMVWHNDVLNTCNLIQTKYSISNLSYLNFQNKVVSYNVGLQAQPKKKPGLIIESDDLSDKSVKIAETGLLKDEPNYVEGGVQWNRPEYTKTWNSMSVKLKNTLLTNHIWMEDFMFSCVNARLSRKPCKFIAPKELKIPPDTLPNGKYDFGVKIYNDVFDTLGPSIQNTYMTLHSTKDGVKNYDMFRDAMNDLVAKAVDFNKGYF